MVLPCAIREWTWASAGILSILIAGLLAAAEPAGGQNLKAEYERAYVTVKSNHESMAKRWYELMDRSQPGKKPMVVRINLPKCFATLAFAMEFISDSELPPDGRAWLTSEPLEDYPLDCRSISVTGSRDSGTLAAEVAMKVRDEIFDGGTNWVEAVVRIDGKIANGRVTGTSVFQMMAAKIDGTITGEVLLPAEAAAAPTVRALPSLDPDKSRASELYAAAAILEQDVCALYSRIRAFAACDRDRTRYVAACEADAIPIPIRPVFKTADGKTAAKKQGGRRTAAPPKAAVPDLDSIEVDDELGLGDNAPPPSAPREVVKIGDDPKDVRERLAPMRAMVAYTARIAAVVKAAATATGAVTVQRGTTPEDPLFLPLYGNDSLAGKENEANRLPSDAGSPGSQDWPFVHAWRFLGPIAMPAARWDPIRLPDTFETAYAEFPGRVGPVRWLKASNRSSGHVFLTNVDSLGGDLKDEPNAPVSEPPRKVAVYYAATTITSDKDVELWFAAGCRGHMSMWVDDVLVARGPEHPSADLPHTETMLFKIKLHKGSNHLLARCEAKQYPLARRSLDSYSLFWMRACVRGGPGDPKKSRAFLDAIAERKKVLPNLPPNVTGFRNQQMGLYPDATPVTAWDVEKGINVRWVTPIIRWGKSSPVVSNNRVFLGANPHVLVCLDALTGQTLWERSCNVLEIVKPAVLQESKKLWQAYVEAKHEVDAKLRELGPHYTAQVLSLTGKGLTLPAAGAKINGMEAQCDGAYNAFMKHLRANVDLAKTIWPGHFTGRYAGYAFPTPVTDGTYVYAKFGTGAVACYDFEGNRRWMSYLPLVQGDTEICISPVLADDKVIIAQFAAAEGGASDRNYRLTALDAATGKKLWSALGVDFDRNVSSPVVMRLTNGKEDMTVVVSDGGTLIRADDGKVLIKSLWGGNSGGTACTPGDVFLSHENAFRFVMLNREQVLPLTIWSAGRLGSYSGLFSHNGLVYFIPVGGSQCFSGQSPAIIDTKTGEDVVRPFWDIGRTGIHSISRDAYVPPTGDLRHIFLACRGVRQAPPSAETSPDKWHPWTYVSVLQQGAVGRYIAHNRVPAVLTPHITLDGTRVYVRDDRELACYDYTGDEGRVYEAEVNASTLLQQIGTEPPADAALADAWLKSLRLSKSCLETIVELKPGSDTASRIKVLLDKLQQAAE